MSDDKVEGVELSQIVNQIRNELVEMNEKVPHQGLSFTVDSVELELRVVVKKAVELSVQVGAKATVGAKLWVLFNSGVEGQASAELAGKREWENSHVVKITLKPKLNEDVKKVGDVSNDRARKDVDISNDD